MRISVKLAILPAAVVVATAASVGWLAVNAASRSATREALRAADRNAAVYTNAVAAHLRHAALALEVTAGNAEVGDLANHQVWHRRASSLLRNSDVFEYVMLVQPSGDVAIVEPATAEEKLFTSTVAGQPWFRDEVAARETRVSDLHISPATRRPSVVIATPVFGPAGDIAAVLVGGLNLLDFSRFAQANTASHDNRNHEYGYLTDRRGLIIAHSGNPSYVTSQTDFSGVPAVRRALDGRTGSGRWVNPVDGEKKIGAYRPLPNPGWAVVVSSPVEVALASVPPLRRDIVRVGALLAVLLSGIGALAGGQIARPLRRLTAVSRAVAAGDSSARAGGASGEIGELSRQFDAMVETLTDQDQHLRRRTLELETMNRELDAFAYSVSHDLRTPLRSIDGFSQVVLEDFGPALGPEGQEHLQRVRTAAQRMGNLIDDLLSLSRLTRSELHVERIDLTMIAATIAAELREAEPDRHIAITIEPNLATVADRHLAEIVMSNLLGNAWKFTSKTADAEIRVGAAPAPGWFIVTDNGAGFDADHAERLFAPFQRFHRTSEFPGNGIGLATVARALHRHGGQIRAQAAPDAGATFTFTFVPSGETSGADVDAVTADAVPAPFVRRPVVLETSNDR